MRKVSLLMLVVATMFITACEPKEDSSIVPAPTADFSASKTAIIAGETVNFNSSVTNATSINWEFTGGNPAMSSEANPTVIYAVAGKYSVTLTAIGSDGQIAKVTKDTLITVDSPIVLLPVAAFTADKTAVGLGNTVKFTDQSSNGPFSSYLWTFEGGTPTESTEANPEVVYNEAGKFQVSLKVVSTNGENVISKTDYITVTDDRIKVSGFIKNLGDNIILEEFSIGIVDAQGYTTTLGETDVFGADNSYEIFISRDYLGKTLDLLGGLDWTNSLNPDSVGKDVYGPTITLQETNIVDWIVE